MTRGAIARRLLFAAMAGLGSFLTALAVLPDEGSRPLWQAIAWRAVRTVGQVAGASLAGYVLVQEVPWQVVLVPLDVTNAVFFGSLPGIRLLTKWMTCSRSGGLPTDDGGCRVWRRATLASRSWARRWAL